MERRRDSSVLETEMVALDATLELASNSPGEQFSMPASQYALFANIHTLATEGHPALVDPTTSLSRDRAMQLAEQRERFDDPITVSLSQLNRMQAEINQFRGARDPDHSSFGEIIMRSSQ